MEYKIPLPVKILSENNRRDHYIVKYKRIKKQKEITLCKFLEHARDLKTVGKDENIKFNIHMVRIKGKGGDVKYIKGKLVKSRADRDYDTDNLESGFKAVRDEIAKFLGINDGNRKRIRFTCDQEKGDKAGSRIEITSVIKFKE